MSRLNFKHLRYFHLVAREGSLTRAAALLNVSQSAVSTQIRLLEESLGEALFERRGRALHLTEAGRIALDHADSIFETGDELVATLRQINPRRIALRVGALSTLSRNFQLSFLRPILGREDVEIVLRAGAAADLFEALIALQLDIVLTNHPPSTDLLSRLVVHRLDEQPVSLVGLPALCAPGLSLKQRLAEQPLVLPTTASGLRSSIDALLGRLGVAPKIAAEVDDMAMMRLLAREGAGLAILPPIVVRDELESGMLVEAEQVPNLRETFYGVTIERRFPNPVLTGLLTHPDG
jgi:LysR family transcriptional activator of nhaA